jgi:hypothetical protein
MRITEDDIHTHLRGRMTQRGVTKEELELTLNEGWEAEDAKPGTMGKVLVFSYQQEWEGRWYEEKEVSVYYKGEESVLVLLTVKARYGKNFPRGERS